MLRNLGTKFGPALTALAGAFVAIVIAMLGIRG